jgi:hypothetical protein
MQPAQALLLLPVLLLLLVLSVLLLVLLSVLPVLLLLLVLPVLLSLQHVLKLHEALSRPVYALAPLAAL